MFQNNIKKKKTFIIDSDCISTKWEIQLNLLTLNDAKQQSKIIKHNKRVVKRKTSAHQKTFGYQ